MAFRDNKDALLARADALQRDNDRLAASLDGTTEERDALRAQQKKNEKALAKLTKQLARYERKQDSSAGARPRVALLVSVALLGLGVSVAVFVATKAPPPPGPGPEQVVEPPQPPQPPPVVAALATAQFSSVRACLDHTDLELRAVVLGARRVRFSRNASRSMNACRTALAGVLAEDSALPGIEAELRGFHDALVAWEPVLVELLRYYKEGDYNDDDFAKERELRPRFDELRTAYVERSEQLRAALAGGVVYPPVPPPPDTEFEQLRVHAVAFVDALVRRDSTLAEIDARLAAMSQFRADHPALDSELLGTFFSHSKDLVRSMRTRGTTELDEQQRLELGFVGSYFRLTDLGASF